MLNWGGCLSFSCTDSVVVIKAYKVLKKVIIERAFPCIPSIKESKERMEDCTLR